MAINLRGEAYYVSGDFQREGARRVRGLVSGRKLVEPCVRIKGSSCAQIYAGRRDT